jgi:hypothetical protein
VDLNELGYENLIKCFLKKQHNRPQRTGIEKTFLEFDRGSFWIGLLDRAVDKVMDRAVDKVMDRAVDMVMDRVADKVMDRVVDKGI